MRAEKYRAVFTALYFSDPLFLQTEKLNIPAVCLLYGLNGEICKGIFALSSKLNAYYLFVPHLIQKIPKLGYILFAQYRRLRSC